MSNIRIPYEFKLIDFVSSNYSDNEFKIQMIGINDCRKTFSVTIEDFEPFVYIRVGSNWTNGHMNQFIEHLKTHPDDGGIRYQFNTNMVRYEMVKRKTLYDFDASKYYKFICIYAKNIGFINKLKSLYYDPKKQRLNESGGYVFNGTVTKIYECMIPPLLRFFHIQKISPSGWVRIEKYIKVSKAFKNTRCDYEFNCKYKDIISLEEKETRVPYKICSFDIEASSSHGDFPNAIKNYKKVAYDIVNYFDKTEVENSKFVLKELLLNIFGFKENMNIDKCYIKDEEYEKNDFTRDFESFAKKIIKSDEKTENKLQSYFENLHESGGDGGGSGEVVEDEGEDHDAVVKKQYSSKKKDTASFEMNICDILLSKNIDSPTKIIYLMDHMDAYFPSLEGDQVTFIGSTFINFGEKKPYLNHCICLNETKNLIPDNQVIEYYDDEKDVLVNWTELIKREDPDIIIGYNIFGFDYKFMFERATELDCISDFMDIGRTMNTKEELGETSIILASGAYDLKYMQMEGRLQVDLYTYMRKEFNLPSYKLDYVSSYLISDGVKKYDNLEDGRCMIYTKNMKGVEEESYVHFEIINHSNDIYNDGEKFKVLEFFDDGFIVDKHLVGVENEKLQWGLAKDDVTPQDIFRLTREGPAEKGIIAKYCIQDCNLVHHIFNKIDVMTSFVEMSKICSVPISYLVLRGQGIKLTSYIGKKCREMDTLMPLISKGHPNDAYEGAIVLEPKCNLYLDNPVACVDYSSLYPSSIISENISHDSKVWTKTYDLQGNLLNKSGITDKSGKFKYDNLDGYKYVDIKYDTFKYERKSAKAAARKVLTGYKVCRYAQFPNGEKAIMPSILHELLAARKATKKQMAKESDPFMKNILDKRQLSIKVTANSLYGQTGAKTSTFYEMDVAASTTATGRKLLIYAREIIENVYKNMTVDTKFGKMITNAEYIYGDTDSVFFTFNLKDENGEPVRGKNALEVTIELAKEAGELATKFLKKPHDLEYEKTFMPFCLLSKKRYVGMLYEEDPNKCKRKSMGIVLKRRDNAPIVKDVYGGVIDILMKKQNIEESIEFVQMKLQEIIDKKIPIEKLIISKSLRSFYKNPQQVAHNVLADRMGVRDPGNKPAPGDRIPYVYIYQTNKKALQGDKIEHPEYIKKNKIKIDYGFYITNQIMKPVQQIYSLVLYDIAAFRRKRRNFEMKLETISQNCETDDQYHKKCQQLKDKEVEKLIFEKYLVINKNNQNNNRMITSFFS